MCGNALHFTNSDSILVEEFRRCITSFSPLLKNYSYKSSHYGHLRVLHKKGSNRVCKNPLREWIRELGLWERKAINKFIPLVIFSLPRPKIALFLNRLFSGDGNCNVHPNQSIEFCSISKTLAHQVQSLLLRFGIQSRIRIRPFRDIGEYAYVITITGKDNILLFLENIGFYGNKQRNADELRFFYKNINSHPNLDTVPLSLIEENGLSWINTKRNYYRAEQKHKTHFKSAFNSSINQTSAPARYVLEKIANRMGSQYLLSLAQSDIFWDEIASKETVMETCVVYDLELGDNHNFIANDIFVHNSETAIAWSWQYDRNFSNRNIIETKMDLARLTKDLGHDFSVEWEEPQDDIGAQEWWKNPREAKLFLETQRLNRINVNYALPTLGDLWFVARHLLNFAIQITYRHTGKDLSVEDLKRYYAEGICASAVHGFVWERTPDIRGEEWQLKGGFTMAEPTNPRLRQIIDEYREGLKRKNVERMQHLFLERMLEGGSEQRMAEALFKLVETGKTQRLTRSFIAMYAQRHRAEYGYLSGRQIGIVYEMVRSLLNGEELDGDGTL